MNVAELIAELDALRPELAGYLVAKGVSASEAEGLASLVDKVASISTGSGGIIPTGTLDIISNGSVDVAAYAMANVNVPDPEITLQEKSVTPTVNAQTVVADEGYDGLRSVEVEAVATVDQATPTISIGASGMITATVSQSEGYVSQGTKTARKQLPTQAAKKVTPTTSNQTAVASGRYATGDITVAGDANLVSPNIKSGISIFGVTGSLEAGYKTVELNADRLEPNGVLSAAVPGAFLFAVAAVRNANGNGYDAAGARAGYLNSQSSVRIYESGTTKMATLAYDGTNITLTNVYDDYYIWNVKVIAVYEE